MLLPNGFLNFFHHRREHMSESSVRVDKMIQPTLNNLSLTEIASLTPFLCEQALKITQQRQLPNNLAYHLIFSPKPCQQLLKRFLIVQEL